MPCDMIATVTAQLNCNMRNFFQLPPETRTNLLDRLFSTALHTTVTPRNWQESPGFIVYTPTGAAIHFNQTTGQITVTAPYAAIAQDLQAIAQTLLPQIAALSTQLLLAQIVHRNYNVIAQSTTPTGAIAITVEV